MVTNNEKMRFRTEALQKRKALLDHEPSFIALSEQLSRNLKDEIKRLKTKNVFSFYPSKGEPDFSSVFFSCECSWFFPKVKQSEIDFFECRFKKDFQEGAFGLMEPKNFEQSIAPEQGDVILVPGLLFDRNGHRLGYGKGFYDRFFAKNHTGIKIGIAFDDFIEQRLPNEAFDVSVDSIVTESTVIYIK